MNKFLAALLVVLSIVLAWWLVGVAMQTFFWLFKVFVVLIVAVIIFFVIRAAVNSD